jgi:hypothetical protein
MESGFAVRHLITELSIASKMCIHVPDEKYIGLKNYPSNTSKSLSEFVVCNEQ